MDLATVLQVPVTCMCDILVTYRNWKSIAVRSYVKIMILPC